MTLYTNDIRVTSNEHLFTNIPIFAVSTFETDYILVKEDDKERALETLLEAGHELVFR